MVVAYDSANAPMDGAAILYLILFAAMLAGCVFWQLSGRTIPLPRPIWRLFSRNYTGRMPWIIPLAIVLGAFWLGGLPLIDRYRVSHMDGDDLQVTSGTISKMWDLRRTELERVWWSDQRQKRARVTQGFDIGEESFSWPFSECASTATLCSYSDSKVLLREGLPVKVTWFEDPWQFGRKRIVRLEAAEGAQR